MAQIVLNIDDADYPDWVEGIATEQRYQEVIQDPSGQKPVVLNPESKDDFATRFLSTIVTGTVVRRRQQLAIQVMPKVAIPTVTTAVAATGTVATPVEKIAPA